MILTVRFAVVVAVASIAAGVAVRTLSGLLLLNCALLIIAILDVVLAGSPRSLKFSRSGDTTCRLGEPAIVTLSMTNGGSRRVHGVVRDAWQPSAGVARTRYHVDIAAGRVFQLSSQLVPTRKGDRLPDYVTIRSVGPLGLAGRQISVAVPWSVRVLPGFPSRRHLPSRLARLRELDGRTSVMVRGAGTEFDSLREYVPGDDIRSIDWRATARASDVMIRTWRPERDRRVVIVIDSGRTSAGRVGDGTRLDASMDAALLLAALASRAGDRVDVMAYDRRVRADIRGSTGAELLVGVSQALAYVDAELIETDARGLVAAVSARVRQRALVVLLTSLEPAALQEGLLPVMPVLTSRHLVIVASARDPRIQDLAAGRGDAAAVYSAAAAARALGARDQMAMLLTRSRVEVVDSPADRLGPDLADRYLSLKASGHL